MKGCEPAMPCQADVHGQAHKGLTKREMFAAMAMQGLLSQHVKFKKEEIEGASYKMEPVYKAMYISIEAGEEGVLARDSVSIADALIAELNK